MRSNQFFVGAVRRNRLLLATAATVAGLTLLPAVTHAAVYTYTNVAASVPSGTTQSRTFALNDGGTLIGDYTTSAGTTFFTYAGGALTPFPTVSGTQLSYPSQQSNGGHLINDAGNFGASGALNTAEPSDGTMVGGYYNPTTSTFVQIPAATTYQTANQVATGIQPYAINVSNNVVGTQFFQTSPNTPNPSVNIHGIIYNSATGMTTDIGGNVLNPLGNATTGGSSLIGISDNNLIVGQSRDAMQQAAFLGTPVTGGGYTFTDLTSLISTIVPAGDTVNGSAATDISANGQYVIGTYAAKPGTGSIQTRSFEYTVGGSIVDLGTLGGTSTLGTQAYSVNDSGQVVGNSTAATGTDAFLYSNGTLSDLNTLDPVNGVTFTGAQGINDVGQIVGYDSISGGNSFNAYLLTPVPEPSSLTLLGMGAALLVQRKRSSSTQR